MPEFVNPKYIDSSRTMLKSPTRLECMMQDLPWILPPDASVSFTSMDGTFTYSPAKNSLADARKKAEAQLSPACASSAEMMLYSCNTHILRLAGATVPPADIQSLGGVAALPRTPLVILSPAFKPSIGAALSRLPGGGAISITARSALVLDGDITVKSLSLDGALRIIATPGARVTITRLRVVNKGWRLRELCEEETALNATPEVLRLRGYALEVDEERVLRFEHPGNYVINETS